MLLYNLISIITLGDDNLLKYILEKFIIALREQLFYFVFKDKNHHSKKRQKFKLNFRQNGTFKIVQFTDLHERPKKNIKTINLMERIVEEEKPDLVVLTGDCIDGRYCRTRELVKSTIDNIAQVMEKRKIPWIVALGNHDCEFSNVNRREQMKIYMSYEYNLSQKFSRTFGRAGDYNVLINGSNNNLFNIFVMDSGDYCYRGYDYITKMQIHWYEHVSHMLEIKFGKIIPSLMFFHIPLRQQKLVGVSNEIGGNRNEGECLQAVDRKLFKAVEKMKNVKGIFCGHDHTNDYVGTLNGVKMGYGRCSGYNGYCKGGFLRGARVFVLKEDDLNNFHTYIVEREAL